MPNKKKILLKLECRVEDYGIQEIMNLRNATKQKKMMQTGNTISKTTSRSTNNIISIELRQEITQNNQPPRSASKKINSHIFTLWDVSRNFTNFQIKRLMVDSAKF